MTLDPIAEPLSGPVLARAIDQLAAVDTDIRETVARIGYPIPRLRPPGFTTLLRIMVSQQISTRAAAAIWGRLTAACEEAATPERFLALDEAALRSIGLSGRKIDYGRGLARALLDGSLDLEQAGVTMPEEDAIVGDLPAQGLRPLECGDLPAVRAQPRRQLSSRRSRAAGRHAAPEGPRGAAGSEDHGAACRRLAAAARLRGDSALACLRGGDAGRVVV